MEEGFLLWLKAQSTGDWLSILDQPISLALEVAWYGRTLPVFKDHISGLLYKAITNQ